MSVASPLGPGRPMSWQEYAQRTAPPPCEYIDGRLVMVPSPTREHQQVCFRLANALTPVIPAGYDVTVAWAWKPASDEFIPDVMVHPRTSENLRFTGLPLLLIEVLSTNRSDDLVLKTGKYAAAGAPHYWVVDLRDRCLDAFTLAPDGLYRPVAHIDKGETVEIAFGPSTLTPDLSSILGS